MDPGCGCCQFWMKTLCEIVDASSTEKMKLQTQVTSLEEENARHVKTNRKLNAQANGIHTPQTKKKTNPGKSGRPKGQKATINKRHSKIDRTETVDFNECPKCDSTRISKNPTGQYDRVVKVMTVLTENVRYVIVRRWCRDCRKQVSAKVPGTAPYARRCANVDAVLNFLNMSGLSHDRTSGFVDDTLKISVSRSSAYRNKISRARQAAPEREAIKAEVLEESHLKADELYWPLGDKRGYCIVALGKKSCLVEVADSRKTDVLKGVLPDYKGTITQDSYAGWLHVGSGRQMCIVHQERLVKRDLDLNPKGDVAKFLNSLSAIHKKIYRAYRIEDPHARMVAADCINAELAELYAAPYQDDKHGTIAKYRKRRFREGYYMTTCLELPDIEPDNNAVERTNRRFVSIRSDGGGNRSQKGMDANSILFTLLATDRINGNSFFDHLVRSASGDG